MTLFERITRRDASGPFLDAGVYEMAAGHVLVVAESRTASRHELLASAPVPCADAIAGATVLTRGTERSLRIEVDVLAPDAFDRAAAAFAAACASYDEVLHEVHPVDGLVRVVDEVFRVQAKRVTGAWSGRAVPATAEERDEMARWRCFRKVAARSGFDDGWHGWDGDRFERYAHPYDLAGKVRLDVVEIEGLAVGVICAALTTEQRALLGATSRPSWLDVILSLHLAGPEIVVDAVDPAAGPATVAAAVAIACRAEGFIVGDRATAVVVVGDERIGVVAELDYGAPDDGAPPTSVVYTRPA